MTRILGIDPGSRVLGYAVIDAESQRRMTYVECGVLSAPKTAPLERRLAEIARGVGDIVAEFEPHVVAMEDVFHGVNARAALALGQARGAVMAVAGMANLAVVSYAPTRVKLAVTGRGRASKQQVALMVRALIGLRQPPRADAADALAVAIAHAHTMDVRKRA